MVLYEVKITQRAYAVSTMYGCNAPEGDDAAAYHQTNGTFHLWNLQGSLDLLYFTGKFCILITHTFLMPDF